MDVWRSPRRRHAMRSHGKGAALVDDTIFTNRGSKSPEEGRCVQSVVHSGGKERQWSVPLQSQQGLVLTVIAKEGHGVNAAVALVLGIEGIACGDSRRH
ncbi:hypothetical protein HN51_052873 [Arachis hypogaea]